MTDRQSEAPSAGLIVIGNEVLSGKVIDKNSPFIIEELRKLGVRMAQVVIIPDEPDVVGSKVREFSSAFTYVFTTGGLGVTHDDITMASIAAAFETKLVVSPELNDILQNLKADIDKKKLRPLTLIPEGAELFWGQSEPGRTWPTVKMHNVYIFPGVPDLLRARFAALRTTLRSGKFVCHTVYCTMREHDIAEHLNQTVAAYPNVDLGSYPQFGRKDHKVRITFDARSVQPVEAAVKDFLSRIPDDSVVHIDRGNDVPAT